MEQRHTLFSKVLDKIKDGTKITFTPNNVVEYDDFLIFNKYRRKQTITFHTKSAPFWIEFDGDEPMRLEDVPTSFLESILKNIPRA
jgi:hypothetical protein